MTQPAPPKNLSAAITQGHSIDVVRQFVEALSAEMQKHRPGWIGAAARANRWDVLALFRDEFGWDLSVPTLPPQPGNCLSSAVALGAIETVECCLAQGIALNNELDDGTVQCGPLRTAAGDGNLKLVKILVEAGAYIHDTRDGRTTVDCALFGGHTEVAEYLRGLGVKSAADAASTPTTLEAHEAILAHVAKEIGEVGNTVVAPGQSPSVRQVRLADATVLFTVGASDRPLPGIAARAEFLVFLPLTWPLEHEQWHWPVRCLEWCATMATDPAIQWDVGFTVPNGDPPTRLASGVGFAALALVTRHDGYSMLTGVYPEEVRFFTVIPIHEAEHRYAVQNGIESLLERMDQSGAKFVVDPFRSSTV